VEDLDFIRRINMLIMMRTTLNLDDELLRRAKHRAVDSGLSLSEYVNRLLRQALRDEASSQAVAFSMPTHGDASRRVDNVPADFATMLDGDDERPLR
jgi:Arc/MetJ family transcription regulator